MSRFFFFIIIFTLLVKQGKGETEIALSGKTLNSLQCNRPHTLFRFGLGCQKSFFAEIGVSRFNYAHIFKHSNKFDYYGALELTPAIKPKKDNNIIGIKAGFELYVRSIILAVEPKYLTDGKNNTLIITPKIGLCIGSIYFYYGYSFPAIRNSYSKIGLHQFSLVIQFGYRFFRK